MRLIGGLLRRAIEWLRLKLERWRSGRRNKENDDE